MILSRQTSGVGGNVMFMSWSEDGGGGYICSSLVIIHLDIAQVSYMLGANYYENF